MTAAALLSADSGAVRVLTLNRPACRNALDTALCLSLIAAIEEAEAEASVRSIVIAGAGGSFCAGADLKEFPTPLGALEMRFRQRTELLSKLQLSLAGFGKPLICAAEGAAVGAGASLVLCCDLVVAADNLRFGFPEIRRGILPAMVLATLHRALPMQQVFALIASGDLIDAATAERCGLITRRVHGDPRDAALALAHGISLIDADLMRRTKALFTLTATMPFTEALAAGVAATLEARGLAGRQGL